MSGCPWASLFRPGVQSLLLPLTFCRFAVLRFGFLETAMDLAFSQHIGTWFRLQQTSRQRSSLGALHFIERVGNMWETGVSDATDRPAQPRQTAWRQWPFQPSGPVLTKSKKLKYYGAAGTVPWKNLIVTYCEPDGTINMEIIKSEIQNKI